VFGTGTEVPLAGSSIGFVGRVALVLCLLVMFVGCDRRKTARPAILMANTAMLRECYCWSIVDGRWQMGVLKYEKK
jgi:hypothetical protein